MERDLKLWQKCAACLRPWPDLEGNKVLRKHRGKAYEEKTELHQITIEFERTQGEFEESKKSRDLDPGVVVKCDFLARLTENLVESSTLSVEKKPSRRSSIRDVRKQHMKISCQIPKSTAKPGLAMSEPDIQTR